MNIENLVSHNENIMSMPCSVFHERIDEYKYFIDAETIFTNPSLDTIKDFFDKYTDLFEFQNFTEVFNFLLHRKRYTILEWYIETMIKLNTFEYFKFIEPVFTDIMTSFIIDDLFDLFVTLYKNHYVYHCSKINILMTCVNNSKIKFHEWLINDSGDEIYNINVISFEFFYKCYNDNIFDEEGHVKNELFSYWIDIIHKSYKTTNNFDICNSITDYDSRYNFVSLIACNDKYITDFIMIESCGLLNPTEIIKCVTHGSQFRTPKLFEFFKHLMTSNKYLDFMVYSTYNSIIQNCSHFNTDAIEELVQMYYGCEMLMTKEEKDKVRLLKVSFPVKPQFNGSWKFMSENYPQFLSSSDVVFHEKYGSCYRNVIDCLYLVNPDNLHYLFIASFINNSLALLKTVCEKYDSLGLQKPRVYSSYLINIETYQYISNDFFVFVVDTFPYVKNTSCAEKLAHIFRSNAYDINYMDIISVTEKKVTGLTIEEIRTIIGNKAFHNKTPPISSTNLFHLLKRVGNSENIELSLSVFQMISSGYAFMFFNNVFENYISLVDEGISKTTLLNYETGLLSQMKNNNIHEIIKLYCHFNQISSDEYTYVQFFEHILTILNNVSFYIELLIHPDIFSVLKKFVSTDENASNLFSTFHQCVSNEMNEEDNEKMFEILNEMPPKQKNKQTINKIITSDSSYAEQYKNSYIGGLQIDSDSIFYAEPSNNHINITDDDSSVHSEASSNGDIMPQPFEVVDSSTDEITPNTYPVIEIDDNGNEIGVPLVLNINSSGPCIYDEINKIMNEDTNNTEIENTNEVNEHEETDNTSEVADNTSESSSNNSHGGMPPQDMLDWMAMIGNSLTGNITGNFSLEINGQQIQNGNLEEANSFIDNDLGNILRGLANNFSNELNQQQINTDNDKFIPLIRCFHIYDDAISSIEPVTRSFLYFYNFIERELKNDIENAKYLHYIIPYIIETIHKNRFYGSYVFKRIMSQIYEVSFNEEYIDAYSKKIGDKLLDVCELISNSVAKNLFESGLKYITNDVISFRPEIVCRLFARKQIEKVNVHKNLNNVNEFVLCYRNGEVYNIFRRSNIVLSMKTHLINIINTTYTRTQKCYITFSFIKYLSEIEDKESECLYDVIKFLNDEITEDWFESEELELIKFLLNRKYNFETKLPTTTPCYSVLQLIADPKSLFNFEEEYTISQLFNSTMPLIPNALKYVRNVCSDDEFFFKNLRFYASEAHSDMYFFGMFDNLELTKHFVSILTNINGNVLFDILLEKYPNIIKPNIFRSLVHNGNIMYKYIMRINPNYSLSYKHGMINDFVFGDTLPIDEPTDNMAIIASDECCVCNIENSTCFIDCGHTFCKPCLNEIYTENASQCPMCDTNFDNCYKL
jgi:hypothetical protein